MTGYRGSATNTNELFERVGIGRLDGIGILPTSDSLLPAQLITVGQTLYVLTYGSGSQAVATVSAYDVSGSEPVAPVDHDRTPTVPDSRRGVPVLRLDPGRDSAQ